MRLNLHFYSSHPDEFRMRVTLDQQKLTSREWLLDMDVMDGNNAPILPINMSEYDQGRCDILDSLDNSFFPRYLEESAAAYKRIFS